MGRIRLSIAGMFVAMICPARAGKYLEYMRFAQLS